MAATTVGLIAGAVQAAAQVWYEYLKSADRNKLKACIDAAEKYIHCNEDFGKYNGQTEKKKHKRLGQFRHNFFKNNN